MRVGVGEGAPAPLAVIDWDYNAWGNKYPPFNLDEVVPTRVADILKLPVFYPRMILEGGSIDVNGTGALLTTESCLLNKNRNPNLSRTEIEQRLRDYLGVRETFWLGDGIAGDDTDGHIDDLARFVSEHTVVTLVEEDRGDENYKPLQENLTRLREMRINNREIDIVTLPMPEKIVREGLRLPASYANFYILCRPGRRARIIDLAQPFPGSPHHRDRLPGIDLGPRHISLPDAAAAGNLISVAALCERRIIRAAPKGFGALQINLPLSRACNRSSRSRREDRGRASCAHQM